MSPRCTELEMNKTGTDCIRICAFQSSLKTDFASYIMQKTIRIRMYSKHHVNSFAWRIGRSSKRANKESKTNIRIETLRELLSSGHGIYREK